MARTGEVNRFTGRACIIVRPFRLPDQAGIVVRVLYRLRRIDIRWSRLDFSRKRTGEVDGLQRAFSDVQSNNYWSATTYAANTDNAWNVNLNNGNVNTNNKSNSNYVWPVRGGE